MNPVIAMLIGVAVMMFLIICTRMHAFPSLIISAILIAVLSGNYLLTGTGAAEGASLLSTAISTVTGGFGGTMASIGIVIGFGCIMGIFLEKSGAAKRMALTILKMVGVKRADVVLGLTGFVVSIPVFCDSGFVILSSLAKEFSRLTKKSMVGLGGILGMGLYITHFMVPPTPGPLAVVSTFQKEGIAMDLGIFILCGLAISVPLFIFSVFLFRWFGNKYPQFIMPNEIDRSKYTEAQLKVLDQIDAKLESGKELENSDFEALLTTEKLPGAGISFTILLLPVALILCNTLVGQIASLKGSTIASIITFIGNPVIALFISLCLGAFVLAKELDNKTVIDMMNDALKDAGPIVMITAGGGALGAVVKATGAAGMMANGIVAIGIPGILVPLLIGTIMRFPQGSGTTAMITGSAIIAPMISILGVNPYLAAMAVCLTAMCPSFLNDSYFHVVTNFSGMDIKTSLKTWTMGSIAIPIFGSVIICILSVFIH
ncbi:MAG: GntP family permease [Lachnospiraceae bacterium]|nr:GntP family permease [Lachnospiraceae bacterium]